MSKDVLQSSIDCLLKEYPEILHGYTSIEYCQFSKEYKSALVMAVPYDPQLTITCYTEQEFENSIGNARDKLNMVLEKIETLLQEKSVS